MVVRENLTGGTGYFWCNWGLGRVWCWANPCVSSDNVASQSVQPSQPLPIKSSQRFAVTHSGQCQSPPRCTNDWIVDSGAISNGQINPLFTPVTLTSQRLSKSLSGPRKSFFSVSACNDMDLNFYADLSEDTGQPGDPEFLDSQPFNGFDAVSKVTPRSLRARACQCFWVSLSILHSCCST